MTKKIQKVSYNVILFYQRGAEMEQLQLSDEPGFNRGTIAKAQLLAHEAINVPMTATVNTIIPYHSVISANIVKFVEEVTVEDETCK